MTRTCATALALVNWKGVFYERYLLDRHVTALEGANGAGKTTVMIAAYVVLLPDLARLRFTNLGETAATGGDRGLYGRLGRPGRPSYAAMELELGDGTRIIAGVQLVRKTEPSLELTPFLVSGLDLQGSLKEILLVSSAEHDAVPELDEVRAAVARLGGKLQVFASAKDYFGALFERGVNPLRLATDEERTKLHDMLRTSMTGGISRALTSELRSFLLKEETGLADTLVRMRGNLEACRRTRTEVAEARALEHEITAIHAAGSAMFGAIATATETAANDARKRKEDANERVRSAEMHAADLARSLEASESERARSGERVAALRVTIEERTAERARTVAARAIAARLAEGERELARAAFGAAKASEARARTTEQRDERVAERGRAREAYERAARGLGDLQAGLDELHSRAHAQRTARARLVDAQKLLEDPSLSAASIEEAYARVRTTLADVDARRARAERERALAAVHESDHRAALAALTDLVGHTPEGELYEVARRALARLDAFERVASRKDALDADLRAALAQAKSAREVKARAAALAIDLGAEPAAAASRALAAVDAEVRANEEEARAALAAKSEAARRGSEAKAEAEALEASAARWEAIAPAIARLDARTSDEVARKRTALADDRDRTRAEIAPAETRRAELVREAELLDNAGGLPRDLLAVRDLLGAELLASRFETSRSEDAAVLEAALGPLAQALVVADPGLAADALAQYANAPATVWLVAEEDVPKIAAAAQAQLGAAETIDVVVKETFALRVTRRPSRPILGREARARRAADLRAEAETASAAIARMLEDARRIDALLRDADRLLGEALLLSAGDPGPRATAARAREEQARASEAEAGARARAAEEHVRASRVKLGAVLELVADAPRLVTADPEARVKELELACADAAAAARELERAADAKSVLEGKLDALRVRPATATTGESETLAIERDRLFAAENALADVIARKDALGWEDLEAALANRGAVRGSIEAQHEAARVASGLSEDALREAESAWERANIAWQTALGERASRESACERLRIELEEAGGHDAASASLSALDDALAALVREREELSSRERELATSIAVGRERHGHAEGALAKARREAVDVETTYGPLQADWRAFAELAESAGVLSRSSSVTGTRASSPAEHAAEARAQRALLATRLEHARGGADGANAVKAAFERAGEAPVAYLEAWLAARAWVMRRLPAQFADVADPADALERLRSDLGSLADRVNRHEAELRGASEDIARGIDVHLRKTATRVRRLNRDLASVAFGSIGAVRVQVKRVERMELVLRALRGGEVQELLFQSDLPFEEALAEVFRRYGGGGRSGPQKILDYREYLDLVVEVQRKASAPNEWEIASPTRLSTGEAIGVGAALMMVVLTEWERDANVLRSDRPTGTLRFLFLDEANRLSPDNLAVLFDLCRSLDLQLLVAAPEVARAFGNTTYRLVRHVDSSGREEVLVSGRRAVAASTDGSGAPEAIEAAAPAEAQVPLEAAMPIEAVVPVADVLSVEAAASLEAPVAVDLAMPAETEPA